MGAAAQGSGVSDPDAADAVARNDTKGTSGAKTGEVATRVPATDAAGFSFAADLTAACLAKSLPF